ncbi:thiopurine S-methyltransferase [Aliikangiella maris]|uniref:Thiopurine S-methyltransferase n=2 Tax=Aliikangiella maris TaxID=3162458 RepID=A0ABV2BVJ5_9GAMM
MTQYWLDRWQHNEINFHMQRPHPLLQKFIAQFTGSLAIKAKVFVPLCGKALDMIFLTEQGYHVVGVELSALAAESFFQENNLKFWVSEQADFKIYQSDNITIYCGDFFKLSSEQVGDCEFIYDRASIIALTSEVRAQYARHLRVILGSARMMLISVDYNQQQLAGPPYSVNSQEISQLFDFAQIEKVYTKDIIKAEPRFAKKGLTFFNECVYLIQW